MRTRVCYTFYSKKSTPIPQSRGGAMVKFVRGLYVATASIVARVFLRSPRALFALAAALGTVRYYVGYVGRGRSRPGYLARMARALPERSCPDLERILRAFWRNHEKNFVELFLLPKLTPANIDRYVTFEGLASLDEALRRGTGAVLAPPHFGNERLLHLALALKGYPLTVMTSAFEDAPDNLRRARLEPAGQAHELLFPSDNPRRLYDAVARNRVVQFSPTAAGGTSGLWCDCFGYTLLVNTTPARVSLKTGAPLLPAFIYRRPNNRHHVVIEPPLGPPPGGGNDAAALTRTLMQRVEKRVHDDPDQFYWMWPIIRTDEAEAAGKQPPEREIP